MIASLIEAWERAREVFGDEIAQEATLLALGRKRREVDEIAYLMATGRWLKARGYTDGVEFKKIPGKHTRYVGVSLEEWHPIPIYATPEAVVLAKEEVLRLHEIGAGLLLGSRHVGKKNMRACKYGHEGALYYKRNGRGGIVRRCRVCAKEVLHRSRARRKLKPGALSPV